MQRWRWRVIRHLAPGIADVSLLAAFTQARLLGRFWKVDDGIYADIAHNAEKIEALAGEIKKQFGEAGKILVVGISGQRVAGQGLCRARRSCPYDHRHQRFVQGAGAGARA